MKIRIIIAVLFIFLGIVACEKIDQAFEAVDKAKSIKTDLEKSGSELMKNFTGKGEKNGKEATDSTGSSLKKEKSNSSSKDEKDEKDDEKD